MNTTIKVTGKGSVHVIPDVTQIDITVDRVYSDYKEAYDKAKYNSEWIGNVLSYNKMNPKLAKTLKMDISEHTHSKYDAHDHYIGQVVDGYALDQRVRINIDKNNVLLNKLVKGFGKFIEGAEIHIGYTVKDMRPLQLKMIERAVTDAREKATIMLSALDCKLGDLVNIDYGNHYMSVFHEARTYNCADDCKASTPESLDITPEDLSSSEEVDVVWAIEN